MIEATLPLLSALLILTPLDAAPSAPNFGTELQQLASEFSSAASQLLTTVDSTVIDLTRLAYVTVLLVGVFLYFTRIQKRLGRELITGGIVLAILSEFVFPSLSKL
jgi:hypothetical protein